MHDKHHHPDWVSVLTLQPTPEFRRAVLLWGNISFRATLLIRR
jgi:hypothetical protein